MKYVMVFAWILSMTQLANLKPSETSDLGTYPVDISLEQDDGTVKSTTILVTVKGPNTVINETTQEAIDGKSFETHHLLTLSDERLIVEAGIQAWSLESGKTLDIDSVHIETHRNGTYTIEYATEKGTSITIDAFELDSNQNPVHQSHTALKEHKNIQPTKISTIVSILFLLPLMLLVLAIRQVDKVLKSARETLFPK